MSEAIVGDDPSFVRRLAPEELERASRREDSGAFLTARALQRTTIGQVLGVEPSELVFERRCTTCGSTRHGKPRIGGYPEWSFSLSYTHSMAVLALARAPEVGIDVEHLDDAGFAAFDDLTLAEDERPALAALTGQEQLAARAVVWARKEAVLKATGHGLVVDPSSIVVSAPDVDPALVDWRAAETAPAAVRLLDVPLADARHRAAVAVLSDDDVTLTRLGDVLR